MLLFCHFRICVRVCVCVRMRVCVCELMIETNAEYHQKHSPPSLLMTAR